MCVQQEFTADNAVTFVEYYANNIVTSDLKMHLQFNYELQGKLVINDATGKILIR